MIDDSQQRRVRALFPNVPDVDRALIALIDAEAHRRLERDGISGAFHALALTQGALLKEEYDLSTHSHHAGWILGAAVVDIRELTVVNMNHGFETGDQVLHDTATALGRACPKAKVVRVHSDAFAVLFGPLSEQTVTPELTRTLRSSLRQNARLPVEYSVGLLELLISGPSHWQVLGPLVWAECERTLVLARRAPYDGVLKRKIALDGGLPEEAMSGR
jgi:GGDEF domain-containing protein